MTAHCSESEKGIRPRRRSTGRMSALSVASDRQGSVLLVVTAVLVVMLASVGLAVDLGRGYVEKLHIGRAVDAGALAAAKTLRLGPSTAEDEAEAVARANGIAEGIGDIDTNLTFGTNANGENTVLFEAQRTIPTTFMRVVGLRTMSISASGLAAVPPLDVVLVLDTSGSLATAGAFDELQDAALQFVQFFDDTIDQMGLVTFQVTAHDQFILNGNFTAGITSDINAMASAGDTNIGEGFRFARLQINGPSARPNAAKVVVFFTDGRPTAYRGMLGAPAQDRVIAVNTVNPIVRGYFNNPGSLPSYTQASPNGCGSVATCFGQNATYWRTQGTNSGLAQAALVRQDDVLIYTIGLGNPAASSPLLVPDLTYMRQLANEGGIVNPGEPQGKMYFAPSGAELEAVFNEVARDLIVRLAG